MASIKVNLKEFSDLILHMLLDKLLNPDELLPNNEYLNEFVQFLEDRGARVQLMQAYRNMPGEMRREYKRFRDTLLDESDQNAVIFIKRPKDEEENESENDDSEYILTESQIKDIVMKSVQAATRKNNPNPDKLEELSENILNDLQNNEEEENNDL